jgi:hypothetical protein
LEVTSWKLFFSAETWTGKAWVAAEAGAGFCSGAGASFFLQLANSPSAQTVANKLGILRDFINSISLFRFPAWHRFCGER